MNNGEKKIKIILLPVFDGTGILFKPFVDLCPPGFETDIVKLPTEGNQSYEDLSQKILKKIPEKYQYILLGESFSGTIAIKIASNQPPNLLVVILVSTFIRSTTNNG